MDLPVDHVPGLMPGLVPSQFPSLTSTVAHGLPNRLDDRLSQIDAASSLDDLRTLMQDVAEEHGFKAFAFCDTGGATLDDIVLMFTVREDWEKRYREEGFFAVDPVVSVSRRTNAPFLWSEIALPAAVGRRIPPALKVMHEAIDYGYSDGLAVPYHYVDARGRGFSSLCSFFGGQTLPEAMQRSTVERRNLHLLTMAWTQRAVEFAAIDGERRLSFVAEDRRRDGTLRLTGRERDTLSWAARGKTSVEVAAIMGISHETVTKHLYLATKKLGAANRTAAVAIAIRAGFIQI